MMEQTLLQYARQLEFDKILAAVADYAIGEDAKQKIAALLPSSDFVHASAQLDMTDAVYVMLQKNQQPNISSVSGIEEIAMRAEKGGILSMAELLRVRTMLRNARALSAWYATAEETLATDELFYFLYEDSSLERQVNDAILSESEMSDDASAQLGDIRRRIQRTENSIRDRLDSIIRSESTKKLLQDAVVTMRGGRFVVPVKSENRGAIKGLVHDVSQSGSTYFIEPEAVVEANNRIMELKGEEAQEIERILMAFTSQVGEIAERLAESYRSFVTIDTLFAKAKYAIAINASKPILNDRGYINLKKARHPLISKNIVVPIDVSLGSEYNLLVITGPNTGGKTVTIKTVGLLALMAMSGILLPVADESEISVFDRVLADIGDEQSIEQSLSTFSGHMTNVAKILKAADDRSLVLLDELGAGTDPAEGAALAVAILDRLRALRSKVVATTHYGEIKVYAMQTEGVENASCEFDIKTLKPTYRLMVGVPGMSNALVIAERLGLDERLIESAKANLDPESRRFEDVLQEIEKVRDEVTRKERAAEEKLRQADESVRTAQERAKKLEQEAQKHYERAQHRSKQMMADVEAGAHKLLEEIRKLDKDKDRDRQKAITRAREIARKDSLGLLRDVPRTEEVNYDDLPALKEIEPGMTAFIASIGQVGEILTEPDSGGNVEVKAGLLKTRVHRDMLKAVPEKRTSAPKRPAGGSRRSESVAEQRSGRNEINLLGMNVEEAILEVDRFIDAALLSNLSTVYLIHGKGTGALRAGLQQHLRTMKHVKHFRLGTYGEGESGVTIVELK